jgi:hypothetical protein
MSRTDVIIVVLLASVPVSPTHGENQPEAVMEIVNRRPVVGEPLVVDFVVRNSGDKPICSPPHVAIENSLVEFSITAYGDEQTAGSWGSFMGCGPGSERIGMFDGRCLDMLDTGEELRGRRLVVLLTRSKPGGDGSERHPLGLGKYTLIGEIPWGTSRLRTSGVDVDIVGVNRASGECATRLVDVQFAGFMGDGAPRMGLGVDLEASGSVKRIIDECPESIHANLARSRLLALQAERLSTHYGMSAEARASWRQKLAEVIKGIDEHLRTNPDDPLEVDLLDGKIQLLYRLGNEESLRQGIDVLIARYPKSGRARRAEEMWRQLHSDPRDGK